MPARLTTTFRLAGATQIPLGAADVRTDIDFALDAVYQVSGLVTRDSDATAVDGMTMTIETTSGSPVATSGTDGSGAFQFDVTAGQYRVRSDSARGLLGEFSDGSPCTVLACDGSGAAFIDVVDQDVPGVDFSLAPGGAIAGQLRDAVRGGVPIRPVHVEVYTADGTTVTTIDSDTGAYQTEVGLPGGSYRVLARTDVDYLSAIVRRPRVRRRDAE